MTKICKICKKRLPEEGFYLNRGRYRLNRCKKCLSKRSVAFTLKNRKIKFSRTWFKKRFDRLRRSARVKGKKFELAFEEYRKLRTYKNEKCFYCGITEGLFSIDRMDNNEGYILSNCVVACWRCNQIKSKDYTAEEMKILGRAFRRVNKLRGF